MPSVPGVVYDGDFSEPSEVGLPIFEKPFPEDPKNYVYRVPYWQAQESYTDPVIDETGPYGGFATGMDYNFKDIGGGIISFEREFALVPDSRIGGRGSYVYSYQNVGLVSGAAKTISENALTTQSYVQYDYFHTTDPSSIELPNAPRAVSIAFGDGSIIAFLYGWGFLNPNDPILAEDAILRLWKGNIYERQQRFIICRELGA